MSLSNYFYWFRASSPLFFIPANTLFAYSLSLSLCSFSASACSLSLYNTCWRSYLSIYFYLLDWNYFIFLCSSLVSKSYLFDYFCLMEASASLYLIAYFSLSHSSFNICFSSSWSSFSFLAFYSFIYFWRPRIAFLSSTFYRASFAFCLSISSFFFNSLRLSSANRIYSKYLFKYLHIYFQE